MTRGHLRGRPAVGVGGAERGGVGQAGQAVVADADRDDGVEAQEGQVGQVVSGEAFVGEMGLDEAEAAQAAAAGTQTAPVRQLGAGGATDQDVLDGPGAVEEHADLAADLAGEAGQLAGQFVRDEAVGGEPATDEALERLHLAGFETMRVAVNLDEVLLWAGRAGGPRLLRRASGCDAPEGRGRDPRRTGVDRDDRSSPRRKPSGR
jgi:hypothetical protein